MINDTADCPPLFDIGPLIGQLAQQNLVLTANSRLARHIKSAWDKYQQSQGLSSWPRAAVYAVDDWLLARWRDAVLAGLCPDAQLLTGWQEQELWRDIIGKSHGGLLQMDQTAALASQAREMLLRFDVDVIRHQQLFEFSPDSAGFYAWLVALDKRLKQLKACTKAMAIKSLADNAAYQHGASIVLVGLHELTPLVSRFFTAIKAQLEYLPAPSLNRAKLHHAFTDKRSELASAAAWAASHYRQNPNDNIAIVLPDMRGDKPVLEYYLRREFNCLGKDYTSLPVNFSQSFRLGQTPLVQSALDYLSLYCEALPLDRIVTLLQSRFFGICEPDSADTSLLIEQLFSWGATEYDSASLRNAAPDTALAGVLREQAHAPQLKNNYHPSAWAQRWCEILDEALWPSGESLDSLEYQQLQQWFELLERLACADEICGKLPYRKALALLKRVAAQTDSQPQTPAARVQVLGLLEAEGLQFEQIWLCNMQADTWPPAARSNPFIPLSLQRQLQMPHSSPAREWEFATQIMTRFMQSCAVVRASYAQISDGVPAQPSALIDDFTEQVMAPAALDEQAWAKARADCEMEMLEDWQAPAVDAVERDTLRGGSRILELQSDCERHAFVAYRLGLRALDEPSAGLSPMARGIILHSALYRIWGKLGDSARLKAMRGQPLAELIRDCVQAAIGDLPAQGPQARAQRWKAIEQQRLEGLIGEWLELEARREPFTVSAREKNIAFELEGLPLRLQIDRIDTLNDQREFIIDYKSGKVSASGLCGDVLKAPQLPLYLQGSSAAAGLAFASLKPRDMKFAGVGDGLGIDGVSDPPTGSWQEQVSQWQQQLTVLARSFMAGEASAIGCDERNCSHPLLCQGVHHD